MIKLIKNELYKIFHKKVIYIVLAITLGLFIVVNGIDCILEKPTLDENIQLTENIVKSYEESQSTDTIEYFYNKADLESLKIIKEKDIKEESPEEYYVKTTINSLYVDYFNLTYNKQTELAKKAKEDLDNAINKLNNFDWKEIVKEKIDEEQAKQCDDKKCEAIKEETIKVLNYRLNHNIPYSTNDASSELDIYLSNYSTYLDKQNQKDELLTRYDILQKQNNTKDVKEIQYLLENELYTNDYTLRSAGLNLLNHFTEPFLMTIVILLIISSTIIAEEFNKGTIKQLLVKPYSRTKIIISKMLATLITTIVFAFTINILLTIIEGLFEGNLITIFNSHAVYDFTNNSVIYISYIKESLITFIYSLPEIILLGIFVFAMATLLTSSAFALGLGFGAYLSSDIFMMLLERFKFLSYMPTVNYNLSMYMYGNLPSSEQLSLTKAIWVDVISFVVLFALIIIVFNKKDIKNQ